MIVEKGWNSRGSKKNDVEVNQNLSTGSDNSNMITEDLTNFHDEVKDRYAILLQKLKALKFAANQYAASTRFKRSDLQENGNPEILRHFRPVTPANVRVLLRITTKEVVQLRARFENWKEGEDVDVKFARQADVNIRDLETQLSKLTAIILQVGQFVGLLKGWENEGRERGGRRDKWGGRRYEKEG